MTVSETNIALTKPFDQYVHARRVGDLVFVAGQGCRHPESDTYQGVSVDEDGQVSYDTKVVTRAVLKNVERALASHQLGLADVVDVTVFLKSMADFADMNHVWNEFFSGKPAPTRTTVAVADLPGMNFVEMKAIAAIRPPS